MKMARVTIRMFETETPFAKIDLPGNLRLDHPLQRAVDRRAADPVILRPDQIHEVIRAEMALLPKKDVDDQLALAGPPATRGA